MKDERFNKSSIIYLKRSQLEPHPDNLRAVIEGNSELYTLQGVKK